MKTIIPVLGIITILFSCNNAEKNTTHVATKAPIDSLVTNWETNWNKHDSAGVRNMFMADAILVDDNLVTKNADEFSQKWIHPAINIINNLASTKLQEWSDGNRAGYTGKYALDVVVKDSVVSKPEGIYSVNWLKNETGEWKITSAVIYSFKK